MIPAGYFTKSRPRLTETRTPWQIAQSRWLNFLTYEVRLPTSLTMMVMVLARHDGLAQMAEAALSLEPG